MFVGPGVRLTKGAGPQWKRQLRAKTWDRVCVEPPCGCSCPKPWVQIVSRATVVPRGLHCPSFSPTSSLRTLLGASSLKPEALDKTRWNFHVRQLRITC